MKVVAQNRRARFDYEILETVEAGIVLSGQEVKSCRLGHMNLMGSYVSFLGGCPLLRQAKIMPYRFASGLGDYDPAHDRRLLMKRSEVERLQRFTEQKGIALIPLEVRAGRFIKVLLGVARGRKKEDKRQRIKERDVARRVREGRE